MLDLELIDWLTFGSRQFIKTHSILFLYSNQFMCHFDFVFLINAYVYDVCIWNECGGYRLLGTSMDLKRSFQPIG